MARTPDPHPDNAQALAAQGHTPEALGAPNDGYSIRFGVILLVNGEPVPITTADIADATKKGIEFTLQKPVALGTMNDFSDWVNSKFGVQLPKAADLPPPLDKVVGTITGMLITVQKAHVKVPGSDPAGQKTQITLEVNGMFQPPIDLIDGKLGVGGLVFGFSNEAPATPPAA